MKCLHLHHFLLYFYKPYSSCFHLLKPANHKFLQILSATVIQLFLLYILFPNLQQDSGLLSGPRCHMTVITNMNHSHHLLHCFHLTESMPTMAENKKKLIPLCPMLYSLLLKQAQYNYRRQFHKCQLLLLMLPNLTSYRLTGICYSLLRYVHNDHFPLLAYNLQSHLYLKRPHSNCSQLYHLF